MASSFSIGVSLAVGVGAGWAFHFVWRSMLPRARSRVFWQALPVHASGMLHCPDPDDVMRHYGALMKHTGAFAARNTLAVCTALLPVAALFLLSAALHSDVRRAPIVEVRPAVPMSDMRAPIERTAEGGLLIDRREVATGLRLLGTTLDGDALASKRAFCSGMLACLGYELMLFETHRLPAAPPEAGGGTVVVRPRAFATNPFWPYLDDLELAFLAGTIAGGFAAGWRSSRAREAAP